MGSFITGCFGAVCLRVAYIRRSWSRRSLVVVVYYRRTTTYILQPAGAGIDAGDAALELLYVWLRCLSVCGRQLDGQQIAYDKVRHNFKDLLHFMGEVETWGVKHEPEWSLPQIESYVSSNAPRWISWIIRWFHGRWVLILWRLKGYYIPHHIKLNLLLG